MVKMATYTITIIFKTTEPYSTIFPKKNMLLKHYKKFNWLVFIIILPLVPTTTYGKPPTCNESSALSFAFARVNPIQVFNTPDLDLTEYIEMKFGRAYPITKKKEPKLEYVSKEITTGLKDRILHQMNLLNGLMFPQTT